MSFQYAKIDVLDAGVINVPNQPKCIYRLGINPVSNPDPNIGGLIVDAAQTNPPGPGPRIALFAPFNIPLTDQSQSIGIADNFKIDPSNCLTLLNDKIKCNIAGKYQMYLNLATLFPIWDPLNIVICQLLINGQEVFMGPPGLNSGLPSLLLPDTVPLYPTYTGACFINSTAIISLNTNDEISLVLKFQAGQLTIALTSGLCINKLD